MQDWWQTSDQIWTVDTKWEPSLIGWDIEKWAITQIHSWTSEVWRLCLDSSEILKLTGTDLYFGLLSKSKNATTSTVSPSSWGCSPSSHLGGNEWQRVCRWECITVTVGIKLTNYAANIYPSTWNFQYQKYLIKPEPELPIYFLPQLTRRPLCHTCEENRSIVTKLNQGDPCPTSADFYWIVRSGF